MLQDYNMLIQRYLFREIFYTFLSVILVTLLIAVSNKFVRLVTKMSYGEISPEVLFQAILLQIPELLAFLLPVALFLGILLCLSKLFADNEIPVMFACGLSWRHLIYVSLILALIAMLLAGLFTCFLGPKIAKHREQLLQKEGLMFLVQIIAPGKFHSLGDHTVIYIGDLSDNRQELKHLFVMHQKDKEKKEESPWQLITAERGKLIKDQQKGLTYLQLQDGYRYSGHHDEFTVIEFGTYQKLLEQKDLNQELSFHRTMPTKMLWDKPVPSNLAELQWRLSVPLSAPLLALLAIPLSRVSPRQGRYGRLFIAVLICILYYNLLTISKRWVAMEAIPAYIGLWWVHLVLFAAGAGFLCAASGRFRQIRGLLAGGSK